MIFEWGTTCGDSWKQRVCGLKDRGTLKSKLCGFLSFLFYFFSSSFLFVSLQLIILSFLNKFM